jgi:hypothetical protein
MNAFDTFHGVTFLAFPCKFQGDSAALQVHVPSFSPEIKSAGRRYQSAPEAFY